jgi:predicted nucleotidyltransferase component of viral defense system
MVFKGGTSLSKAWKLIERFSEDIDLAVDRCFFGFEGELKKKQRTKLRKASTTYITEKLYPDLEERFREKGLKVDLQIEEFESSDQDPVIILVKYPYVIESPGYVNPWVKIEIGCRSLIEPYSMRSISSFINETYPRAVFAEEPILIPVVDPERTLLEKIFLLHEEFQRAGNVIRVDRMSRHLYDIYKLSSTVHAKNVLANRELYVEIVNHRQSFTKLGGVDYRLHNPQTVNPIPPPNLMEAWKRDYVTMQEQMIYAESPNFETMIGVIQSYISQLNQLDWQII